MPAWEVFTRAVAEFSQQDAAEDPHALTIGPGNNEVGTVYSYGAGAHSVRLLANISPDVVLVHQMRMVGFNRVVGSKKALQVTPRDLKDELLTLY